MKIITGISSLLTLLFCASRLSAQMVIHDEVFALKNWNLIFVPSDNVHVTSVVAAQVSGGVTGNARMLTIFGTQGFSYQLPNIKMDMSWDPATQGPIDTIVWQIWNKAQAAGEVATMELAAQQGDSLYIASATRYEPPNFPFNQWQEAQGSIHGSDFSKISGSGSAQLDLSPQGKPIFFGYLCYVGFFHTLSVRNHRISFFDLNIQPLRAQDVTSQTEISRGVFRYDRATNCYAQTVTIKNIGSTPISGTVSLVLDGLSAGTSLFNGSGVTKITSPANAPYSNLILGQSGSLAPGESATLNLEFAKSGTGSILYTTRVLAGAGGR